MSVKEKLAQVKGNKGRVETLLDKLSEGERKLFIEAAKKSQDEYSSAELTRILKEETGEPMGHDTLRRWRENL